MPEPLHVFLMVRQPKRPGGRIPIAVVGEARLAQDAVAPGQYAFDVRVVGARGGQRQSRQELADSVGVGRPLYVRQRVQGGHRGREGDDPLPAMKEQRPHAERIAGQDKLAFEPIPGSDRKGAGALVQMIEAPALDRQCEQRRVAGRFQLRGAEPKAPPQLRAIVYARVGDHRVAARRIRDLQIECVLGGELG